MHIHCHRLRGRAERSRRGGGRERDGGVGALSIRGSGGGARGRVPRAGVARDGARGAARRGAARARRAGRAGAGRPVARAALAPPPAHARPARAHAALPSVTASFTITIHIFTISTKSATIFKGCRD